MRGIVGSVVGLARFLALKYGPGLRGMEGRASRLHQPCGSPDRNKIVWA